MAAAYEFAAAEWGWTHEQLEAQLTDELFVFYLDAAQDRVVDRYRQTVEAARTAYITARDRKQYERWRRHAKREAGLTGRSLEAAVNALAMTHPEYIVEGPRG